MIPKVTLNLDGSNKEYPIVLKNAELVALEQATEIGVPIGVMHALQNGSLGVGFFAEVITLGLSRTKRTPKVKVLDAMTLPVDEYMMPCLQAVFIAAGRPEVARQLADDGGQEEVENPTQ